MEAARTSETLLNFYQTTRRYNPEDSHLRTHRRENLKSYITLVLKFLKIGPEIAQLLQMKEDWQVFFLQNTAKLNEKISLTLALQTSIIHCNTNNETCYDTVPL
jgi:hypothetical protein